MEKNEAIRTKLFQAVVNRDSETTRKRAKEFVDVTYLELIRKFFIFENELIVMEVSWMARFLILWRLNPVAPWPTDPVERLKFAEKTWAVIDDLIKKGKLKEFGYFLDGNSGYAIGEGESADTFRDILMFLPHVEFDVKEIIPYEKGKEIRRAIMKARVEAIKK